MRFRSRHLACLALAIRLLALGVAAGPLGFSRIGAQTPPPKGFDKLKANSVLETRTWLGQQVTVVLSGVPEAMQSGFDPRQLVLYLDGLPLKDTRGVLVGHDRRRLRFWLNRTPENKETWVNLYHRHKVGPDSVSVGVGLEAQGEVPPEDADRSLHLRLYVVDPMLLWVGIILALITLGGLLVLGVKTELLKELPRDDGSGKPYSLGRVQMSFWFALVAAAFLFIWAATQQFNGILTEQALVLIGIGTGTALGSAAIQVQKAETARRELAALQADLLEVSRELYVESGRVLQALTGREKVVNNKIADVNSKMGKSGTRGFWCDLICDKNGPAFHRFQILVWTIILGAVFVFEVLTNVAMPKFDSTLLALLGISGGTYLGFKIPERQG